MKQHETQDTNEAPKATIAQGNLTRRSFGRMAAGAGLAETTSGIRPNLLFVFSDQQSSDMLGSYHNDRIVTPNLDRFARQAVRFEHCISNSPLCTPYRGLLLSGMHPLRSGALENDVRMLPGGGNYFGEVLRDAGYCMGYVGKWHLYGGDRVRPIPPGSDRYGFDHTFLSNNCTLVYDSQRAYYWDEEGRRRMYGDWEPYAQARQAMRFIDENADKPFALFLSWHPPHNWFPVNPPAKGPEDGYGAPADLLRMYDPAAIRLRGNCADTLSSRLVYRGHMAMCTSLDRAFGWLMDKLRERSLERDTIVVYTSDHGDTLLSHGFRHNKMRPEVESIRVPLLIRFPRMLDPRTSELLVGTLDLMPTLLAMMGLRVPPECQGRNLMEAMAGRRDNEVKSVPLFLLPLDWRGVYTRRYTYAFDTSQGGLSYYRQWFFQEPPGISWNCLFDHQEDSWEMNNLFQSPEHRTTRDRLHEQTLEWMRRFDDRGWPYDTIARAVFRPEDLDHVRNRRLSKASGLLTGRPIDRLSTK
ncbi:MAG: sulfatase-like hydrolase/transferase [Bryobacterales bacterium]|nr:sulfatase-like hydrolase/transferase [Bryobacterales bacterium]